MKLETGELESVPILLTIALAEDPEEWWIDLHLYDGTVRGVVQNAEGDLDHYTEEKEES